MTQQNQLVVLHVSGEWQWQGGEQQLSYLLTLLDHRVRHEVVCPHGSRLHLFCREHRIPCHLYRTGRLRVLKMVVLLRKLYKTGRFQILHCHDRHACIATWFSRVPLPTLVLHRASDELLDTVWNRLRFSRKYLKFVVCPSRHVAQQVEEVIKDPSLIKVIYSSIDPTMFYKHPRSNALRNELGVKEHETLIGTIGMIRRRKDLPTFINVAEQLIKQGKMVRFVIIGEGPEMQSIQRLLEQKQLTGKVTMTGFRDDLSAVYPDLDIFLLTSNAEGFSTVILEAFASGVPVVASAVGGITEIVEEEVSGLLAQPGDVEDFTAQVIRLMETSKLAERMSTNARAMMERFEANTMVRAYHRVYLDMLDYESSE